MDLDVGKSFIESFDWLKPKNRAEAFKLGFVMWLLLMVYTIGVLWVVIAGFSVAPAGFSDFESLFGMPSVVATISLFFAILVLFMLAYIFVYFIILSDAMKYRGFSVKKFSFLNVAGYIGLGAAMYLYVLFYSPVKKLAYLLYACIAAMVALLAFYLVSGNIALFLLLMLPLIGYGLIVTYNTMLLILSTPAYFEKKQSILGAIQHSIKITKGNVFPLFVAYILLAVVLTIIQSIFTLPFVMLNPADTVNPFSAYVVISNIFTVVMVLSIASFITSAYKQLSKGKK